MDKIKKGGIKIAHCPTEDMIGTFYKTATRCTIRAAKVKDTKFVQQFQHSCAQECVGERKK